VSKTLDVVIVSRNSWRAKFLSHLVSPFANVRYHDLETSTKDPNYENSRFVLWDYHIDAPPKHLPSHDGFFLFDYSAEGDWQRIKEVGERWNVPNVRSLLLFPERQNHNAAPLPLPPPKQFGRITFGKPKALSLRTEPILFLCAPTALRLPKKITSDQCSLPYSKWQEKNQRCLYNQRLEWAERLFQAGMLGETNGLVEADRSDLKRDSVTSAYGFDIDVFVDRQPRGAFHRRMRESRVVLSPAGHSRWAYRHVESMFNRALTVSADLSGHRSLPQLPEEALIMVPDGEFDAQMVQELAADASAHQEKADIGYDFARRLYSNLSAFLPGSDRQSYRRSAGRDIAIQFLDQLRLLCTS
jgi:hypothetical protein